MKIKRPDPRTINTKTPYQDPRTINTKPAPNAMPTNMGSGLTIGQRRRRRRRRQGM